MDSQFDERQSECSLPIEYLGYAPVIAVMGAMACVILAVSHVLVRCLPPLVKSFFIFNTNEDNRLCIDPVLMPQDHPSCTIEKGKRISLIPVLSSSSLSSSSETQPDNIVTFQSTQMPGHSMEEIIASNIAAIRAKSMSARLIRKWRFVTGLRSSTMNNQTDQV